MLWNPNGVKPPKHWKGLNDTPKIDITDPDTWPPDTLVCLHKSGPTLPRAQGPWYEKIHQWDRERRPITDCVHTIILRWILIIGRYIMDIKDFIAENIRHKPGTY